VYLIPDARLPFHRGSCLTNGFGYSLCATVTYEAEDCKEIMNDDM